MAIQCMCITARDLQNVPAWQAYALHACEVVANARERFLTPNQVQVRCLLP